MYVHVNVYEYACVNTVDVRADVNQLESTISSVLLSRQSCVVDYLRQAATTTSDDARFADQKVDI